MRPKSFQNQRKKVDKKNTPLKKLCKELGLEKNNVVFSFFDVSYACFLTVLQLEDNKSFLRITESQVLSYSFFTDEIKSSFSADINLFGFHHLWLRWKKR